MEGRNWTGRIAVGVGLDQGIQRFHTECTLAPRPIRRKASGGVILWVARGRTVLPEHLIACGRDRWIKIDSAFLLTPAGGNRRSVDGTGWITINRATYDACLDPRYCQPKGNRS